MAVYNSIESIESELPFCKEIFQLLALLEKVNPCNQLYRMDNESFIISYSMILNLLNFRNIFPLKAKVTIIGMPISICSKGYWGDAAPIEKVIEQIKGFKVVLNSDSGFKNSGRTLSAFVFENRFSSFGEYLNDLRSSYRRRVMKAINKGKGMEIRVLSRSDFSHSHYELYLSVMNRTQNPLEILPMKFFTDYEAEFFEFVDKHTGRLLGFIQLKELEGDLYFLFGGFKKDDNEAYDLYYNMLLKILQVGIERGFKFINFGQTAEESKLKIGCRELPKYLYVHHSNPIINKALQCLLPIFSYKPYTVKHNVYKGQADNAEGIGL